jgi:hypothetical protein
MEVEKLVIRYFELVSEIKQLVEDARSEIYLNHAKVEIEALNEIFDIARRFALLDRIAIPLVCGTTETVEESAESNELTGDCDTTQVIGHSFVAKSPTQVFGDIPIKIQYVQAIPCLY